MPQAPTKFTFSGERLTFNSRQSFEETQSKIHAALKLESFVPGNLEASAAQALYKNDKGAFEKVMGENAGYLGFTLFGMRPTDRWLAFYDPKPRTPRITTYTIGNPQMARTVLIHDYLAGIHTPIRIHLVDSEDGSSGCSVTWTALASLICVGALPNEQEKKLRDAANILDTKTEAFLREVTGNA